jgi:hypothetical protein
MADATLRLNADTRDLKKATKDLKAVERQSGRTEKATKNLTKSYAGMGRVLGRLAGVISVGLITRGVIRNTIAQEKAVAQLNAVLKSTGRFTEEASQGLQDFASSLQQTTTFGDEAILNAQSLLLTFKQIGGEEFPRATKAILDMSIAMDQGLKESTIQLGKALNDPITGLTALQRVGITFTDSQKDMIRTMQEAGDIAGAQKIILEELESQFQGSAEAARNTFGGALEGLSNTVGDLLEGKGGGLKGATDAINDLNDALNDPDVKEGIAAITAGFFRMLETLAKLPAVVGFLTDELRQLFGVVDRDDFVRREEEIEELKEQMAEAEKSASRWWATENSIFNSRAESLRREIALKERNLELDRDFAGISSAGITELEALPGEGLVPRVEQETEATDRLNETKEKTIQLMRVEAEMRSTSKATDLLADLEFENSLIGLNNIERETAIALRSIENEQYMRRLELGEAGIAMNERETEAIKAAIEERGRLIAANDEVIDSTEDTTSASVDFGRAATSNLTQVVRGTESLSDAFSDMASSVIQQLIRIGIQAAITKAFGGTSFDLGAFFGPSRATGGALYPGRVHQVAERGPEMITSGNRQYVVGPPTGGNVTPITKNTSTSNTTNVFNMTQLPVEDPQQWAYEVGRNQRKVNGRNR